MTAIDLPAIARWVHETENEVGATVYEDDGTTQFFDAHGNPMSPRLTPWQLLVVIEYGGDEELALVVNNESVHGRPQ